jgi:predicted transcriptional regulator
MKTTKKISEEKVKEIKELRQKGYTYEKIAETLGISQQTVGYYCNPQTYEKFCKRQRQYYEKHKSDVNWRAHKNAVKREWVNANQRDYHLSQIKHHISKLQLPLEKQIEIMNMCKGEQK